MKKILMFSLLTAVTGNVFAATTLTEAFATGTTVKFATKLSEKLPTGYKVKIDLNNGKGLVAMTCSGTTCTLSSNALPKVYTSIYRVGIYNANYRVGIYDAKGVLQGETMDGSYVIVSTAVTVTTGYIKISNSGTVLPDTATLGSGANDWACTKDSKTGLTWEVKTDDRGLRDKDWYYSWYKPIGDNGGNAGYTDIYKTHGNPNCSTQNNCNTDAFTNAVNTKGLCGKKDWRMPTVDELMTLVIKCSDSKYEIYGSCTNYNSISNPTINSTYFPNTVSDTYWSSLPNASDRLYAWNVNFKRGESNGNYKGYDNFVRLVREETPPTTTAYTKISNSSTTLPDTAVLGSGSNDWACTKDNKTGLTWEVKTDDGGLRDKDWQYSWYKPSGDNGGDVGYTDIDKSLGAPNCSTQNNCNTDAFTKAVNTKGLCGKKDWRMPTKDELMKLVVCSDGNYKTDGACTNWGLIAPTINSTYFPNTVSDWYWSSSLFPLNSRFVYYVNFYDGYSVINYKSRNNFVRLVR
jgi:hypothetical protein